MYDLERLPERPTKKRKLVSTFNMARYSVQAHHGSDQQSLEAGGEPRKCSGSEKEESSQNEEGTIRTSDREELIQCIKRGQRPTWVPKPGLEALCAEVNAEPNGSSKLPQSRGEVLYASNGDLRQQMEQSSTSPPPRSATDALRRSLSALHTGDFHESGMQIPPRPTQFSIPPRHNLQSEYSSSPPLWLSQSPNILPSRSPLDSPSEILKRSRAPSLGSSLSSSFVMRVPTSPLVHSTNNPSLDFSPRDPTLIEMGKTTRRRTLPPHAFESLQMSPMDCSMPNFSRPLPQPQFQRDGTSLPLGHRPRRSLSSFTYQPATSPHTPPLPRSRRPSLASDVSPRQRASMVGSFEESILRGRMSTPPSKPLDFVAQIGVLGKGNCPASLKCPAHVTVPFPAVFYNYPSSNESRSISDDNPSPYVGTIDLEHNLKPPEPPSRRTRRSQPNLDPEALAAEITSPENTHIGRALAREAREKKEKSSPLSKVPAGGAYRVPQQGQLQIIIKNPNKTAVKLFLVPYDLEGMLPGTKTFVRQRSFSSGPILEAALTETRPRPATRESLGNKDILRYLIHLKFCCTAKGRFYLYDTIRVVFANRVPDDKEKLRNEVQLPEPRFSPYRPVPEGGSRSPSVTDGRFSPQSPIGISPQCGNLEDIMGSGGAQIGVASPPELTPIAFHLVRSMSEKDFKGGLEATRREEGDLTSEAERTVSPIPGFLPSTSSRGSPVPWPNSVGTSTARSFSLTVEAGDGLISRKLRELNGNTSGHND